GNSPVLHGCQGQWGYTGWGGCFLMRDRISPLVQLTEESHARPVGGVRGEVECEGKSLEVFSDRFHGRVIVVEPQLGGKLRLNGSLKTGRYVRGEDLATLAVEIAAKTLEVPAEEHHVTAKALLCEEEVGRNQRCHCRAMRVDLMQAR